MPSIHFCTLFDHNYLPRGLVLYRSLMKHCPTATLHVLCLTDECYNYLISRQLPGLTLTRLEELENFDVELLKVKTTRKWIEYIFTMSPCWPLMILQKFPDIEIITSIDCDAAFFSDPTPAITEHMQNTSVGIVGHRFPKRLKHLEMYGIYNVGFQSFRNDKNGLKCLSWWREKCLEWCEDRLDSNRFADQKYLDLWPKLFEAKEYIHSGLNVAPWNVDNFIFTLKHDTVYAGIYPLVFVHFAQMRPITANWVHSGLLDYRSKMTKVLRRNVYEVYGSALAKQISDLNHDEVFSGKGARTSKISHNQSTYLQVILKKLKLLGFNFLAYTSNNLIYLSTNNTLYKRLS